MFYYITRYTGNSIDAGTKAPKDINIICKGNKWVNVPFVNPGGSCNSIKKIAVNINNWRQLYKLTSPGDFVLYQHPMYFGTRFADQYITKFKKKGIKCIALIHDLESLRNYTSSSDNAKSSYKYGDLVLLKKFDYIIAHNKKMKEYLVNNGFESRNIVCLEIFDYLCETPLIKPKPGNRVAIAGNLDAEKCGYIYEFALKNPQIEVNVFGGNYSKKLGIKNIYYKGSYSPEEITGKLDGAFGVVWDGPTIDGCTGTTGEYLKFNNPHKTSMYLASGIPVITWKKAAIADFVLENNIGIVVDKLEGISNILQLISERKYYAMVSNVEKISKHLREGYYFNRAIELIKSIDKETQKNEIKTQY